MLPNSIEVIPEGLEAADYLFFKGNHVQRVKRLKVNINIDKKKSEKEDIDVLKRIRESDIYNNSELDSNASVVKPITPAAFISIVKSKGYFCYFFNKT
jgi:hypothetical protein